MACKIELINPKNNKTINTCIVDGNYKLAQNYCDDKNKAIKDGKYWTVTIINV